MICAFPPPAVAKPVVLPVMNAFDKRAVASIPPNTLASTPFAPLFDDVVEIDGPGDEPVKRRGQQADVLLHFQRGILGPAFEERRHAAVRPSAPAAAVPARGGAGA